MMRVRVTRTMRWAPDGINMVLLAEGTIVDLPDGIAVSWVDAGIAQLVDEPASAPAKTTDVTPSLEQDDEDVQEVVQMASVTKKIIPSARGRSRRFRP